MNDFDAIVTDADQRVALEVIRCLGSHRLKVCAVERVGIGKPLGFASKYCTHTAVVSDYTDDKFISLCERARAIFAISSNTILSILQRDTDLTEKFLLPTLDDFVLANNTHSLTKLAHKFNIAHPLTNFISVDGPFAPESYRSLKFPVILKFVDDHGLFLPPADRYRIVAGVSELERARQSLGRHHKDLIVQEYIDGESYGYSALYDRQSRLVAGIGHKRLRQYPINGGPSTYCEAVLCSELHTVATDLFGHLNWRGPIMAEYKKDRVDGKYKLIEINPRYWGSLPLARHCGINIPFRHYSILTGNDRSQESFEITQSRRLKFRLMDIVAWQQEVRENRLGLKSILSLMTEFFTPSIGDGIFCKDDHKPVLRYIINRLRRGD